MNRKFAYVDELFKNYPDELSDNYSDNYSDNELNDGILIGGTDNTKPFGGFPPIILCKKVEIVDGKKEDADAKTKREFKSHKTAISISQIMAKRRKKNPLVARQVKKN